MSSPQLQLVQGTDFECRKTILVFQGRKPISVISGNNGFAKPKLDWSVFEIGNIIRDCRHSIQRIRKLIWTTVAKAREEFIYGGNREKIAIGPRGFRYPRCPAVPVRSSYTVLSRGNRVVSLRKCANCPRILRWAGLRCTSLIISNTFLSCCLI